MKTQYFLIIVIILIIFYSNTITAELDNDMFYDSNGLSLGFKKVPVLKQGEDYTFSIHVYNSTNGAPLNNDSTYCTFHLYHPTTGNHIIINNDIPFGSTTYDFYLNIDGGNFSEIGSYSYVIACIGTSNVESAVFSDVIYVESSTSINSLPKMILMIFLLLFFTYLIYVSYLITKIKNKPNYQQLQSLKEDNILEYYTNIAKCNVFIVGYFGIYIFMLVFLGLLNVTFYSLGINEFSSITFYFIEILGWGLIPFCIYWLIWFVIFIYKTGEKILDTELGGFRREYGGKKNERR